VAALLAGARDGQVGDLNRLLTSGVPANVRDANGFTPLMLAVVSGHLPAARALLDGGALVPVVFVVERRPGQVIIDPPEGLFEP